MIADEIVQDRCIQHRAKQVLHAAFQQGNQLELWPFILDRAFQHPLRQFQFVFVRPLTVYDMDLLIEFRNDGCLLRMEFSLEDIRLAVLVVFIGRDHLSDQVDCGVFDIFGLMG